MKKGKKLLAIIVGILMMATLAVTVAACGNKETVTRVDVIWYDYEDDFLATLRDGDTGLTKLLASFGKVVNHDSKADQATQLNQVNEAIAGNTNCLLVNAVKASDDTATQSIVDAAKAAGIPIIFFNREVSDTVVKSYNKCMFIGTKPEEAGIMQGQLIASFLLKEENINTNGSSKYAGADGKTIKYAILRGDLDNPEAIFRTLYSVRVAQKAITDAGKDWVLANAVPSGTVTGWTKPGDTWLNNAKDAEGKALSAADKLILDGYIYGTDKWDGDKAGEAFKSAFKTTADATNLDNLGIIISNNDGMALGVIKVLQNDLSLNKTGTYMVPVFGVDATAEAKAAMAAKSMVGTILQSSINYPKLLAQFAYLAVGDVGTAMKIDVSFTKDAGVAKVRMPYEIVA